MESIINSRNGKEENQHIDVLVSFDGSSPLFVNKSMKSRNVIEQEERPNESNQEHKRPHPKVNLPFFRNNRSKKIKVFNIKSNKWQLENKYKWLQLAIDSIHGDSTQETETNNSNNLSQKAWLNINNNNDFIREAKVMQILNVKSPSMSVPRERLQNQVYTESLKPLQSDLFNAKAQIFNGNWNYKRFEILQSRSNFLSESQIESSHKHCNSVLYDSSSQWISRQNNHNNSYQAMHYTLEPETPTMSSNKFALPELSRHSERRKHIIPHSFARK